jgi:superfamily II DNA or RNA helicase
VVSAVAAVRDAIARAILGDPEPPDAELGEVTLRSHQVDAVQRVRAALDEFGGALLADEPGLGKTYVSLALARHHTSTIVVAPAALRTMWYEAAARAAVEVTFVSFEKLSRGPVSTRASLVIVDEAHHVCNSAAARYAHLAEIATSARVVLLSATPVRNRRSELDAELALFLGRGARVLDEAARARCLIRRNTDATAMPAVTGPRWHHPPVTPNLATELEALPPALPAFDGREARALLTMTLARCWASSLAALDAALRRRLLRGAALEALLEAGRVPTRAELRAWAVGDDAVQLAFPMLAVHQEPDTTQLSQTLETHLSAVRRIRSRVSSRVRPDATARAALLLALRAEHPNGRVVAFTSFAATAEAMFAALRAEPGVALLTARGARTASGVRPRQDVLAALGPTAGRRRASQLDDLSLVITTDVLSEGVNLQGASVVVHLDVPWTPAGLEQRVGRAARIGSLHTMVHVHGVSPPRAAERLLALASRHSRKETERLVASRAPVAMERLRQSVGAWRLAGGPAASDPKVAAVPGERAGALALVQVGDWRFVVAGYAKPGGAWRVSDGPGDILALLPECNAEEVPAAPADEAAARAAIARWVRNRLARSASQAGAPASAPRRQLLRRADAVLATAAPHMRAQLAERLMRLRERLATAVSAGAEMLVLRLARDCSRSGEQWLAECERAMERAEPVGARSPRPGSAGILALLLLTPRPCGQSVRRPDHAPRAVST